MNLAVLLYGTNSLGINADWPARVVELGTSTIIPNDGNSWLLMTTETFTAYKAARQADINSFKEVANLEREKQRAFEVIDGYTRQMFELGAEFPPGSGKRTSLSAEAQIKLVSADNIRDELIYPLVWNTEDNNDVFTIPDSAVLHTFVLNALNVSRGLLDAGTSIKTQVRSCISVSEVISTLTLNGFPGA